VNPILDILADLQNDRARAVWLSTIPLGVIQRDHADIAAVLGAVGFSGGLAYLAALVAHVNSVRLDDGSIPIETRQITDYSRKLMWGAVKQGEMVE
jgi:hypothetical protein